MKNRIKSPVVVFLLLLTLLPSVISVWARSYGTAYGIVAKGGDSPLTVQSAKLTFDIPSLPQNDAVIHEDLATITADYFIHNPTSEPITTTVAVPICNYGDCGFAQKGFTNEGHGITVNGVKVDAQLRHAYKEERYTDLQSILLQADYLRDEGFSDGIYSLDAVVTEYELELKETDQPCYAFFYVSSLDSERMLLVDGEYARIEDSYAKSMRYSFYLNPNNGTTTVKLVCIGYPLDTVMQLPVLYTDRSCETRAEGRMVVTKKTKTTLREFALRNYDPESGVSEVDAVSAVIDYINVTRMEGSLPKIDKALNVSEHLRGWYQYELTVGAGETVKNSIVTPLHTNLIVTYMDPYEYTYLFRVETLESWSEFGKMDIEIVTPYYLTNQERFKEFEKTENGYAVTLDGIPQYDIYFHLCTDPSPERVPMEDDIFGNLTTMDVVIFMSVILFPVVVAAAVPITLIVLVTVNIIKRRKSKGDNNESP